MGNNNRINYCVGGNKIEDLIALIDDNEHQLNADVITWVGLNNLVRGDSVQKISDLYKKLMDKLAKLKKHYSSRNSYGAEISGTRHKQYE